MVTMREATEGYSKRYYGDKGLEILKEVGGALRVSQYEHDIFHIIASGVANLQTNDEEMVKTFAKLDENGFIERNAGIKAELLQAIYLKLFLFYNENNHAEPVNMKDDFKEKLKEFLKEHVAPIMLEYIDNIDDNKFSHIKELDNLFVEYKGLSEGEISDIDRYFTDEEIEFHMKKAEELYSKLRENHPECIVSNELNFDSLLDLDLKEFSINNFMNTEKLKINKMENEENPDMSR